MLRFEWNALRHGDAVMVHDPSDAMLRLLPGEVVLVDADRPSHDVAIRVGGPDDTDHDRIVRPGRFAVHLTPLDGTEDCWRCERIAAG
jgi:hypothetical protein